MIYENIKVELKEAMKNGDSIKRDCFRSVIGKAKTAMKEAHMSTDSENISDDMILDAINKEVKQLNQTLTALKGCEDTNLYIVSEKQLDILKDYLPKQMEHKEVEEAVAWILSNGEYNNFGEKMKVVMKELRGKADNNMIRKVVENYK